MCFVIISDRQTQTYFRHQKDSLLFDAEASAINVRGLQLGNTLRDSPEFNSPFCSVLVTNSFLAETNESYLLCWKRMQQGQISLKKPNDFR